jgi:hypothetical protein
VLREAWEYQGWRSQLAEDGEGPDGDYIGKFPLSYGRKSMFDGTFTGYEVQELEVDEVPALTGDYEGMRSFMAVVRPPEPFAPNVNYFFTLKACLHYKDWDCSEPSNEVTKSW